MAAYSRLPPNLTPAAFANWGDIRSEAEYQRKYAEYSAAAATAKAKVTECRVVLKKVSQLEYL